MQRIKLVEPVVMLATVLQWLFLATLTGTLVGMGTSVFLYLLYLLTESEAEAPLWLIMLLLPLGGLISGLLMHWGYKGNKTGLDDASVVAVNRQSGRMPFATVWVKPIAALVTLGSGGSAGKEGPCSHIGATVAAGVGELLKLNSELRKRLVACGVSAGFAGVFGTPIAGAVYGVEILAVGYLRHDFLFPAITAGVAAFEISKLIGIAPYQYYTIDLPDSFSELLFMKTVLIGIACGLIAWLFVYMINQMRGLFERLKQRFGLWPPLLPMIGGAMLALLVLVLPTDYLGLSIPLMNRALDGEAMPWLGFFWKLLLVAITLGSGFYAGIVTPQFVIGALAGSILAQLLGMSPALGAAIGLVSVVSAASDTPIAAILMGVELFGQMTGTIYVAGASVAAYLVIGHRSVYPAQKVGFAKTTWMQAHPGATLELGKFSLSYDLRRWLGRMRSRYRDRSGR